MQPQFPLNILLALSHYEGLESGYNTILKFGMTNSDNKVMNSFTVLRVPWKETTKPFILFSQDFHLKVVLRCSFWNMTKMNLRKARALIQMAL